MHSPPEPTRNDVNNDDDDDDDDDGDDDDGVPSKCPPAIFLLDKAQLGIFLHRLLSSS